MQASLDSGLGLVAPLERGWHYRELIRAVVRRELAARFRGSILGWLWAVFGPIVMLTAYTIIFSSAVGVPRSAQAGGVGSYALSIFTGLIIFNLFSELAYRAPGLLHEHVHFIKKSIFPSETLAWTATIRALTYAGISFAVLIVFALYRLHGLSWTILFLPFVVIPLQLFLLGATWFLMALGSFTRDVAHLMISIVPVLMFATPIFYTIDDAPRSVRLVMHLNLIGNYVEMVRDILIHGRLPNPFVYLGSVLVSLIVFRFGYRFFQRYKAIFVDVI
ncbi:Transport permease protein [Beijerinckiaceae bacterium RH AL1]|nr:Transport permease protein [Beijerinckiaceae bacterium RH CH11]VVB44389.1 Transport permease protein [Beijerinckiaceae bacterium RH AL8]VVC54290.1 Transport permease protein [Beijerinckiaceae bacterium RH AL1]